MHTSFTDPFVFLRVGGSASTLPVTSYAQCHQSWQSLPTSPGLSLPCRGPRTPFTPRGSDLPAQPRALPPVLGLSWCCWQPHALAGAAGQTLVWDPALLSTGNPYCSPHPRPREPAAPCCTMTRTMKNNSSKKDVKERNVTNTPENLPDFFNIHSFQFF